MQMLRINTSLVSSKLNSFGDFIFYAIAITVIYLALGALGLIGIICWGFDSLFTCAKSYTVNGTKKQRIPD